MHTDKVKDSDGVFGEWQMSKNKCPFCKAAVHNFRIWESLDGGHVDEHHKCLVCLKEWWVDGPDS